MPEYMYDREFYEDCGTYNVTSRVAVTIKAEFPDKAFVVRCDGLEVNVDFEEELTSEEELTLDQIIADTKAGHPVAALQCVKEKKNKEIDQRTVELISDGFTYDGEQFSLSIEAQSNWDGLEYCVKEGYLTPPTDVSTINDGEYILADASGVHAFYQTAVGTKKARLDSGRALKQQVNDCDSITGVLAIEDNR